MYIMYFFFNVIIIKKLYTYLFSCFPDNTKIRLCKKKITPRRSLFYRLWDIIRGVSAQVLRLPQTLSELKLVIFWRLYCCTV